MRSHAPPLRFSPSHTSARSWARSGPPPRWRTGSCGPAGWRWCWPAWRAACAARGRPRSAGALLLAPTSWRLRGENTGFHAELEGGTPVVACVLRVCCPFFFSASSSSSCFPLAYFLFRLPLLQTRKNTACGKLIRSAATRRPVADTSQSPSTGGVSPPPRGRSVCVCVCPPPLSPPQLRGCPPCVGRCLSVQEAEISLAEVAQWAASSELRLFREETCCAERQAGQWRAELLLLLCVCVCVCVFEAWFRYIPAQH